MRSPCKWLVVLRGACHCNFAGLNSSVEMTCMAAEKGMCPTKERSDLMTSTQQHDITAGACKCLATFEGTDSIFK